MIFGEVELTLKLCLWRGLIAEHSKALLQRQFTLEPSYVCVRVNKKVPPVVEKGGLNREKIKASKRL